MITYGLQIHDLETHQNPAFFDKQECITAPRDINHNWLYKCGTHTFVGRDLLTLKLNGLELARKGDKIVTPLHPPFTGITTVACDFYVGTERSEFQKVGDLYEKVAAPVTPTEIYSGMELELDKKVRYGVTEKVRVIVENVQKGMYVKADTHRYRTSPTTGFIIFEIIENTGIYGPLCFYRKKRIPKKAPAQITTESENEESDEEPLEAL